MLAPWVYVWGRGVGVVGGCGWKVGGRIKATIDLVIACQFIYTFYVVKKVWGSMYMYGYLFNGNCHISLLNFSESLFGEG